MAIFYLIIWAISFILISDSHLPFLLGMFHLNLRLSNSRKNMLIWWKVL